MVVSLPSPLPTVVCIGTLGGVSPAAAPPCLPPLLLLLLELSLPHPAATNSATVIATAVSARLVIAPPQGFCHRRWPRPAARATPPVPCVPAAPGPAPRRSRGSAGPPEARRRGRVRPRSA